LLDHKKRNPGGKGKNERKSERASEEAEDEGEDDDEDEATAVTVVSKERDATKVLQHTRRRKEGTPPPPRPPARPLARPPINFLL
jgi:hypothetical protein